MAEQFIHKLKTDDDFKRLIPPLKEKERMQLEESIIRNGCREPICIWNGTILDGHNRYEICTRNQIPFYIKRIFLRNREEAIVWICANQLGRRNITEEMRRYLIGKRYETEKILGAHNAVSANRYTRKEIRTDHSPEPFGVTTRQTKERLGEEYHISHHTVSYYGQYSRALDILWRVVPEFTQKILSGEVKISHRNIVGISQFSEQDIMQLRQLTFNDIGTINKYVNMSSFLPKKSIQQTPSIMPVGSIKDMPSYDPDAEISSLTFTIPSWISSINRACTADLYNITDDARSKLQKELIELKKAIDTMFAALRR